ncbi:MAG TPA: PEP-CTERM sorting domain-containing protein [Caulobacteraceae bacterium]|jgi:hypothetical protein|nr:PEP-CTERM sorting domain-containing protein [Caulobacteraceae bacterium]
MIRTIAAIAALTLAAASAGAATYYETASTIDASSLTIFDQPGFIATIDGTIDLPTPVTLNPRDILYVTTDISPPLALDSLFYPGDIVPGVGEAEAFPVASATGAIGIIADSGGSHYLGGLDLEVVDISAESYTLSAVNFALDAVPEPAPWALTLVGIGAMGAALRFRRALA